MRGQEQLGEAGYVSIIVKASDMAVGAAAPALVAAGSNGKAKAATA